MGTKKSDLTELVCELCAGKVIMSATEEYLVMTCEGCGMQEAISLEDLDYVETQEELIDG